jgi:hypothetical protein
MDSTGDARQAVTDLRQALQGSGLAGDLAVSAQAQVSEMDAALGGARPDRPRVARALERLTRLLTATGSLATAGAAPIGPLQALAGWLGSACEPVNLLWTGKP